MNYFNKSVFLFNCFNLLFIHSMDALNLMIIIIHYIIYSIIIFYKRNSIIEALISGPPPYNFISIYQVILFTVLKSSLIFNCFWH